MLRCMVELCCWPWLHRYFPPKFKDALMGAVRLLVSYRVCVLLFTKKQRHSCNWQSCLSASLLMFNDNKHCKPHMSCPVLAAHIRCAVCAVPSQWSFFVSVCKSQRRKRRRRLLKCTHPCMMRRCCRRQQDAVHNTWSLNTVRLQ